MNSRMPTPEEIEELTAFLPLLYADGFQPVEAEQPQGFQALNSPFYTKVVYEFFYLLAEEHWADFEYRPKQSRDMLEDRDAVARATLAEVRTMLTVCKRGENFCSGWWASMIEGGQVRRLLERLLELNEESPERAP